MSMIQNVAVIPLNAQVDDVIVNNPLAVARGRNVVEYALVASATGLVVDVLVGTTSVAVQIGPSLANRVPLYPDDYNGRFVVMSGDRIIIRARNTTGANINLFFALRFTPV